jgi:dienelactone hydrolase
MPAARWALRDTAWADPSCFRTAAALPGRVGAGCSFHGGGLTTDKPDSPHLLIPKIKASMLIAIADNDDQKEPTSKDILRKAFDEAKVPAEIEVYKGANHGWMPPDSQNYNAEAARKAGRESWSCSRSAGIGQRREIKPLESPLDGPRPKVRRQ